jgi:hypothetical protein
MHEIAIKAVVYNKNVTAVFVKGVVILSLICDRTNTKGKQIKSACAIGA